MLTLLFLVGDLGLGGQIFKDLFDYLIFIGFGTTKFLGLLVLLLMLVALLFQILMP